MRTTVLLSALVALLVGAAARATVIQRLTLEEVEGYAAEIFVGTVRLKEAVEGGPPRNLIETEVTFENLEVLKGEIPGATASYRFAGGTIGKRTLTVVGVPRFEVGARYVLFLNAGLDRLCPAVGWGQGRYTVVRDRKTDEETICDSDGRPVYRFEEGRPVLAPAKEGDRPVRLAAFLGLVREITRKREDAERKRDARPGKGEER